MAVDRLPKLNFSVPFAMTSALPVDANAYFESYTAAEAAAATAEEAGSSNTQFYYGELILVVENSVATTYQIQPDKTLSPVGSAPMGDNKTIEVVDGKIQIIGVDEASAGQQLRIGADGNLEWFTPDTSTVEGLGTTVAGHTSDIQALQTGKADKATTLAGYGITDAMTADAIAQAIQTAIASTGHASFSVVESIPAPEEAVPNVLYLYMNSESGFYDIYAKINGSVVRLDDVSVNLEDYSTTEEMTQAISAAVANKVDKVAGSRLITSEEATKLQGIADGAEVNVIDDVSDEFSISVEDKVLSLVSVAMQKVTGLPEALAGKVSTVEGKQLSTEDYTTQEKTKLQGIAEGANVNLIEAIKAGETSLQIANKVVTIPVATASALGLVKGSDAENSVSVSADGVMTINSLNVNKLVQTDGEFLILDGGNASIA